MPLHSCHFVVTGATGWLGRATLDVLQSQLGAETDSRLMAISRSETAIALTGGRAIRGRSWEWLDRWTPGGPLVVFHHAFVGKGQASQWPLAVYRQANQNIRQRLERFLHRHQIAGLFVPSSGAAYAYLKPTASPRDPLVIYGQCKYEDEQTFSELAARNGWALVMPRVFNLSGPYINNLRQYALACIILHCLRREDVVLTADHPVWRSYYPAANLIRLALKLLAGESTAPPTGGHPGAKTAAAVAEPRHEVTKYLFDTVGAEVVEISQLARRCVQLLAGGALTVRRPPLKNRPKDYYVGAPRVLRALEQRWGLEPVHLDQQILDTAEYLKTI